MRAQVRARRPDAEGFVEREGVRVFYEVHGDGQQTVLLMPTWSIVHSQSWKLQVPYLARRFRVLVFDGRGNGRSDRPPGVEPYVPDEFALDALAVMDATGTERATLVGSSCAAQWMTILAAERPERVDGVVYLGPAVALAPPHPERDVYPFEDELDTDEGWAKYNAPYWRRGQRDFLEFFAAQTFSEPHSTRQIEQMVEWGLETDPETLANTNRAVGVPRGEPFTELLARVRCAVLVIHGDDDRIRPHAQGAALAEATGGELVTLAGSGHLPQLRDPVRINLLLRAFLERVAA